MTVYVDCAKIEFRNEQWCHMLADTLVELHCFAHSIGVNKGLFHKNASYPHYDITIEMQKTAIFHGAILADRQTIIRCAKKLKNEMLDNLIEVKNSPQLELF